MDLTILTSNYGTPDLVINLLKSIKQTSSQLPNVVVMNTSIDSKESEDMFNADQIPYYNFRGGSHGEAVNLGFKKINTRYVLLVDSDVIFLKDFNKVFEKFKETGASLMGKIVGDCGGKSLYPRIEPWYCFIDLQQLKAHKVDFCDVDRSKKSKLDGGRVYDIGSTMYEDVLSKNLSVADIDIENNYFKHYGGMSWRTQKYNPNDVDTDIDFGGTHPNKMLWDIGMRIKMEYIETTQYLKDVDIKNLFV